MKKLANKQEKQDPYIIEKENQDPFSLWACDSDVQYALLFEKTFGGTELEDGVK